MFKKLQSLIRLRYLSSPHGFHFFFDKKRNKKSSQINGSTLDRSHHPLAFDKAILPVLITALTRNVTFFHIKNQNKLSLNLARCS
jgi:hypothetical protein